MSGREIESRAALFIPRLKPAEQQKRDRAAAVHVADRVAAEHPHPLDDDYPQLAGQAIACDSAVQDDVRFLLTVIGLLEADLDEAKTVNARLKGGQP
ncbi:hypothetical protein [Streptomyces liliifuscus]|uniref:Uncharacterized protein n=1 Tax=Streptomyces liliifuscus TaxID=2797636 RepID=A0A7T7L277_9ACTN|nr:hypothetical protein [Streptomyces liliifuscus]QQM45110.1 hypothetical protein JEQ17_40745 [Streptomyces liliifuscus]